jgi:hypothetical protein
MLKLASSAVVIPLAVKAVPAPVALNSAPAASFKAPLIDDDPAVTAKTMFDTVKALEQVTLKTVVLETTMTSVPAPLVMTASSAAPGVVLPIQLAGLLKLIPSPAPFQVIVAACPAERLASRQKKDDAENFMAAFMLVGLAWKMLLTDW